MSEYPIRILPNKKYARRININSLYNQCKEALLIRRLDCKEEPFHIIGGYKILNEGIINDDVLEWSTNLLGGEFKIEDICWRQIKQGINEWNDNEDDDVDICDYNGCYEQITSKYFVCISLCRFHNVTIPYKRKFGSEKDLKQYIDKTGEIIKTNNATDEQECHATITIEHKPIMLNYWHMTVGVTPKDFETQIPRDGKKNHSLKKRVKEALHMHILNNVICEVTNIENIPLSLYVK